MNPQSTRRVMADHEKRMRIKSRVAQWWQRIHPVGVTFHQFIPPPIELLKALANAQILADAEAGEVSPSKAH